MKVLFATSNPAKVKRFEEDLKKYDIELISMKDLDFNIKIEETGKTALENAYIKAKACYEKTNIPIIAMDDTLFLENIPDELQPGTHVRRVNGKTLDDDEMIEYYSNLAKQFGGRITAKWIYGMVVYNKNNYQEFTWSKDEFYIVDKINDKRNVGYPLNSISISKDTNKYFVDLDANFSKVDKHHNDVIKFIVNSLK